MTTVNRRDFGKLAGILTAGSALPGMQASAAVKSVAASGARSFPKGFVWGVATAAYQVEGAVKEDGRGVSIWDTFSHTPGRVATGENGDVATDSYHRYAEDIAVMKSYGVKALRFSIAWPRIFPNGTGQPNQKGIDFYRRFVGALREAGIEPYCTLYHWDLPQALEDKGGWQSKETSKAFGDYAAYTVGKLGDVIKNWMTINEMGAFIEGGYGNGHHAPGLKLSRKALAQTRHHAVLGHGLAVQAVRAHGGAGARVGSAENVQSIIPAYNSPEHVAAARTAFVEENAQYLTVMHTGKYTDGYLRKLGADAPVFTAEELKTISSATDFQGINCYTGGYARAADTPLGYAMMPTPASYPHAPSEWLRIAPEAIYWSPKFAAELLGVREIYITENGCSSADVMQPDGHVYDTDRVAYLTSYLGALQRGVSEGVPVKGYFLWSLLDNFEWATGYSQRFGITHVDFATQKRTPKLSAGFYKNVIERNGL